MAINPLIIRKLKSLKRKRNKLNWMSWKSKKMTWRILWQRTSRSLNFKNFSNKIVNQWCKSTASSWWTKRNFGVRGILLNWNEMLLSSSISVFTQFGLNNRRIKEQNFHSANKEWCDKQFVHFSSGLDLHEQQHPMHERTHLKAVYEIYKKVQEKERAFMTRWARHASTLDIKPIIYYEKYYLDDAC